MKSVLYIGVGTPWQGGAGYLVRQNMFLQALAECANLHLALFNFNSAASSPPFAADVTPLESPARLEPSRLKIAVDDLFSPLPRLYRDYSLDLVHEQVQLLKPEKFDAVFSYRIDFACFAGVERHQNLILDIDDPEHLRLAERQRLLTNRVDWRTRYDLHKLRLFELNVAKTTQAAFVCQQQDANAFNLPQLFVVPNTVQLPEQIHRSQSHTPTILFVGNMKGGEQSPNGDGVKWFLESIWPIIRQHVPECRCLLVGQIDESLNNSIQKFSNVEVLGFVDAIADVYAQSWLSIAPIRYGTGTRIKVLEALAHACPVVGTPKGCEGIEINSGSNILIGSSETEFANACVDLLKDSNLRHMIGQAGHQLVAQQYNQHQQRDKLVNLLKQILYK